MGDGKRWYQNFEAWVSEHPLLFAMTVASALALLALLAPVERQQQALAPESEGARVYFGAGESIGQAFRPLPSVEEIRVPVGKTDGTSGPLILHLRAEYFGEDIRSAAIFTPDPDTENVVFRFESLPRPPEKLLWVLEAPHGPRKAYWVYHEQDASAFPDGSAWLSGRELRGNVAFTQAGQWTQLRAGATLAFLSAQRWELQSLGIFLVGTLLFLSFAGRVKVSRVSGRMWVGGLMFATILLHAWLAARLPLIIDEGAYLQDAAQTTGTFWPLRDFLTKGPAYVLLLKLWQALVPDTLTAWRLFSALSWAGVIGSGVLLARRFGFSRLAQLFLGGMLALLPGVLSPTSLLLLQVTSTLFATLALLSLAKGAQEKRWKFLAAGALLMTLGYLTRSSTVAAGLAGAVLVWVVTPGRLSEWRPRLRAVGIYIGTGLLLMAAVGGAALFAMGPEKTVVMFNLEAFTIGKLQAAQAGPAEPIVRWFTQAMQILWLGGSWLLAGIVALPLLLVRRLPGWTRLLALGFCSVVAVNMFYHLSDMGYLLPGVLLPTRITMLMIVFGIPLGWLLYSLTAEKKGDDTIASAFWPWFFVCGVWLAGLVILYRGWGAYRAQYVVEFLPPLALLSAAVLAEGWQALGRRPLWQAALVGLFLASWWQGMSLLITRPVSGTVTQEAIREVAGLVTREVPVGEEIFTAQPIVTAASGRPIVAGYSHPGWILYARLRKVPESLRQIYFAEPEEITRWLEEEIDYVVTEPRTNEVYFDYSPERQAILQEKFELVGEVPNDLTEEPFRLYRRR